MNFEKKKHDMARHEVAAHAVQTATGYAIGFDPTVGSPKDVRTGLNIVMRDHASLAQLLISKGLITENEYLAALADGMEEEVSLRQKELSARLAGADVTVL